MNRKYKVFIIFALLEILLLVFLPNVYANSNSCVLTITPDKTQVSAGDTVTLILTVSNITSENGIAIYNGLVEYNSAVFELSVQDSSNGNWKGDLLENSVTFTKSDLEATKENQEIGKIVLKTKSDVSTGVQTITLKSNEFADTTSFKIADVSTSVEITEKNESDNDNNSNNTNSGNSSNSDNTYKDNKDSTGSSFVVESEKSQTAGESASVNDTSAQVEKIPYAGIFGVTLLIIVFGIVVIIGIYSLREYKKIKY